MCEGSNCEEIYEFAKQGREGINPVSASTEKLAYISRVSGKDEIYLIDLDKKSK